MAELLRENKAYTMAEDKLMCRHGFHQWVLKDQKRIEDTSKTTRPVQRCSLCGKEKFLE